MRHVREQTDEGLGELDDLNRAYVIDSSGNSVLEGSSALLDEDAKMTDCAGDESEGCAYETVGGWVSKKADFGYKPSVTYLPTYRVKRLKDNKAMDWTYFKLKNCKTQDDVDTGVDELITIMNAEEKVSSWGAPNLLHGIDFTPTVTKHKGSYLKEKTYEHEGFVSPASDGTLYDFLNEKAKMLPDYLTKVATVKTLIVQMWGALKAFQDHSYQHLEVTPYTIRFQWKASTEGGTKIQPGESPVDFYLAIHQKMLPYGQKLKALTISGADPTVEIVGEGCDLYSLGMILENLRPWKLGADGAKDEAIERLAPVVDVLIMPYRKNCYPYVGQDDVYFSSDGIAEKRPTYECSPSVSREEIEANREERWPTFNEYVQTIKDSVSV